MSPSVGDWETIMLDWEVSIEFVVCESSLTLLLYLFLAECKPSYFSRHNATMYIYVNEGDSENNLLYLLIINDFMKCVFFCIFIFYDD